MVIDPQLVRFFHVEDSKRHPSYVGKEYAWRVKKDGIYGYSNFNSLTGIDNAHTKTGNVILSVQSQLALAEEQLMIALCKTGIETGRLVYELRDKHDCQSVYVVNGLTKRKTEQVELSFWIHDILNYQCMLATGAEREEWLKELTNLPIFFNTLPILYQGKDIEQAKAVYRECINNDEEGIVGKCLETAYAPGRRDYTLMKMKAETPVPGCIFIKHVPGDGNGALEFMTPHGVVITVAGISDTLYSKIITGYKPDPMTVYCMAITPTGKLREPRLCSKK